jgi:hypothetical protein
MIVDPWGITGGFGSFLLPDIKLYRPAASRWRFIALAHPG